MNFFLISIAAIGVLGLLAALFSWGDKDNEPVMPKGDCASCSSAADGSCQIACMMEEKRKKEQQSSGSQRKAVIGLWLTIALMVLSGCASKKNTATLRWWKAFNTRYNTYFNGNQAFIEGNLEKESGNRDNYTELLPLYPVANKDNKDLGKANYDRAIEKSQKCIQRFSIKKRPEWKGDRRKTPKDREWLGRREYNPFLWRAWLLMGKAQFQKGEFDEAAATFNYMMRMYHTQPAIHCMAQAWLAKCYTELDWLYDAEDVIRSMRRDTLHYKSVKTWDYTLADYYIHTQQYEEAVEYLRKVIRHEPRKKQKAREWFLMGQLQQLLGHRAEAEQAYRKVVKLNPPYQLSFNARIAQTEVMAPGQAKQMISKLRRMARSDNNAEYLDQVYYAIGNIYLTEKDTMNAVAAYEKGVEKATRSGIEKGVLLLKLGNVYWELEKFSDARRCYGAAIGLLDQDRPDYEQLSKRSKILDELVPYTDAIHLQDSLQLLAKMPEAERNKAIDRVIDALKKKEREERRAAAAADAEKAEQQRGGDDRINTTLPPPPGAQIQQGNGQWYFYNPVAVNQGKATFQRLWGKRPNADNWQRVNQTVVNLNPTESNDTTSMAETVEEEVQDSTEMKRKKEEAEAASDPHNREYYLAQIPFTEEQQAASNAVISDGLFHAGVIFKDKLDHLRLSEKHLVRITNQYPDYEHMDEVYYHLFLLYSRQGEHGKAQEALELMKKHHPESEWTILLSDPYYAENARFGAHIEDSLYAATYEAFKADRFREVSANTQLSAERFPQGANRDKFIFIEGLSELNNGQAEKCLENMREVVEKYPQSEVSPLAGMIIKGVQEGRRLHGGKFDIGDLWSKRDIQLAPSDSTVADTLSKKRDEKFMFMLTYHPDSVNENQLLYDLAKYNFTNFLVRNFEINIDAVDEIHRMIVSGFLSYDEALQYARMLYKNPLMGVRLKGTKPIIISESNSILVGTRFSYEEYEKFYLKTYAPMKISTQPLLNMPEKLDYVDDEEEELEEEQGQPQEQEYIDEWDLPAVPTNRQDEPQEDPLFTEDAPAAEAPVAPQTPAKAEEPAKVEEPAKTEKPAKTEETKKTDAPQKTEDPQAEEALKKEKPSKKEKASKKEKSPKKEITVRKDKSSKKEKNTKKEKNAKKSETTEKAATSQKPAAPQKPAAKKPEPKKEQPKQQEPEPPAWDIEFDDDFY